MFWDFYLPPIDECMVSRGCSRLEERGSIYLVDLVAIIEVRGEEVPIDWSRWMETGPWVTRWFRAVLRALGLGTCCRYLDTTLLLLHRIPEPLPCLFFSL
jgi:hypothetical protein